MSYVIGLVYRPPYSTLIKFIEILNGILAEISHVPCYIMGDYNINLLKHEHHPTTERFFDTMYSNSLLPMISKPTREAETTATLIDNIFTNKYSVNDNISQGILVTDISDDFNIFDVSDKYCPELAEYQLIRLVNEPRMEKYKERILQIDWASLDCYNSCQSYFSAFMDVFKSVYNECFPVIKVKKKYRNRLPWLTDGLKTSNKHKTQVVQDFHKASYYIKYNLIQGI